jgi:hypothetical protein
VRLVGTEQLQRKTTHQWLKCQPEYRIENNTTNKIVQVPNIVLGKGVVDVLKNLCQKEW